MVIILYSACTCMHRVLPCRKNWRKCPISEVPVTTEIFQNGESHAKDIPFIAIQQLDSDIDHSLRSLHVCVC